MGLGVEIGKFCWLQRCQRRLFTFWGAALDGNAYGGLYDIDWAMENKMGLGETAAVPTVICSRIWAATGWEPGPTVSESFGYVIQVASLNYLLVSQWADCCEPPGKGNLVILEHVASADHCEIRFFDRPTEKLGVFRGIICVSKDSCELCSTALTARSDRPGECWYASWGRYPTKSEGSCRWYCELNEIHTEV